MMRKLLKYQSFLLTRPSRGATNAHGVTSYLVAISTHTPLAGRDPDSRIPCAVVTISTHTPLAGRDAYLLGAMNGSKISTHTPLAGRDGAERGGDYC